MQRIILPCYAKFRGETTNRPVKMPIFLDTVLYQKLINYGHIDSDYIIQQWSDIQEINPAGRANNWLESAFVSKNTPQYVATLPSQRSLTTYSDSISELYNICNFCNIDLNIINLTSEDHLIDTLTPLTGTAFTSGVQYRFGYMSFENLSQAFLNSYIEAFPYINSYYGVDSGEVFIQGLVLPEDFFINGVINTEKYPYDISTGTIIPRLTVLFRLSVSNGAPQYATQIQIKVNNARNRADPYLMFTGSNANIENMQPEIDDGDNPYGEDGTSTVGGGDGTLDSGGLDFVDPAEIPEIPTLGAASCGFMTMYNPTPAQLRALASFMWSSAFDLDTYKKLFSDPMESIIGLAIVPVAPTIGGSQNVRFGTIDSGVSMNVVGNQYKKLDCGSINIEKYVGCFMDYAPYTKISIYLPYIGIRDLSADDITGGSINVQYIVDVLTGACAAFIKHSERGVLYSYNGSCITNVPLTSSNFSGAIQNAVSAVIGGVGVIAGMATGAAPVTAMGVAGLLNSAANTAMNSKPHIQRSGNLGGSAGIMSIQKPYIIIERPNLSVPANIQHYVGQTSNLTRSLGNCSGFTMVEHIHLHDIAATSEELKEIESMLKQGVIL